jgi:hypothetical protein
MPDGKRQGKAQRRSDVTFQQGTPPPPLDFSKISGISILPTSTGEIPRKILITNILTVKILKAMGLALF